jgi:hypothetical protein
MQQPPEDLHEKQHEATSTIRSQPDDCLLKWPFALADIHTVTLGMREHKVHSIYQGYIKILPVHGG